MLNIRQSSAIISHKTLLLLITTCLALAAPALAKPSLDSKTIENWIASQKSLQVWGEKHEEEIARYEAEIDRSEMNPLDFSAETMLKPLRASGLYNEAERLVKKHGFADMEEWANMTIRISKAAASIQMEQMPGQFNTDELQTMMSSGEFTAEQRAMMQQAIDQSNMMRKQFQEGVSAEDKKAIKPHLEKIMQIMEEES